MKPLDAATYRKAAALCVQASLAIEDGRFAEAEQAHAEIRELLNG